MSSEWLEWYYLIYLLPAAVAVFVLLLSGIAGHDGAQGDAADVHADVPMHGDALHVHFTDAGGHAHHDGFHHGDGQADGDAPGSFMRVLGFFGVGRAPLTIVAGSLMIGWGLAGLGATALLREVLPGPAFIPFAAVAAGFGALFTAKIFGELTARLMPANESYAIRREDLVGLTGKVIYPVSQELGRIHVWDRNRTLHTKSARLAEPGAEIPRGREVLITALDRARGYVLVRPLAPVEPTETISEAA